MRVWINEWVDGICAQLWSLAIEKVKKMRLYVKFRLLMRFSEDVKLLILFWLIFLSFNILY